MTEEKIEEKTEEIENRGTLVVVREDVEEIEIEIDVYEINQYIETIYPYLFFKKKSFFGEEKLPNFCQ